MNQDVTALRARNASRGTADPYEAVIVTLEITLEDARLLLDEHASRSPLYAATANHVAEPVAELMQAEVDAGRLIVP